MNATLNTLKENFSPLRTPNFRIYLSGQVVSLIGTWLQSAAQAWVVWSLTGSEAALGTVSMFNALPILFIVPFAGVWADRLDRRKVLIFTQTMMMLLAFLLAFLLQSGLIQIWHIYIMAAMLGTLTALDLPAQQAFLGDLAGISEVRKAVNLNAMIIQTSRILGPALAGLIVARLGAAPAFWLNGLSFLAVIFSLWMVHSSQVRSNKEEGNPLEHLLHAVQFWRTQPRMQDLFILAGIMTFFVWSVILNLLPSVADTVLGGDASTLGLLMASSGLGALIGAVIVAPLAQSRRRSGFIMMVGGLWVGFWLCIMSFSTSLPLSMWCLMMGSIGMPVIMTMTLGLTQLLAPESMRGRLISLFTMVSFGLQPVAAVFVGNMAEHFGVQQAILFNAVAVFIGIGLMALYRPELRVWEVKIKATPIVPVEAAAGD